MSIIDVHTHFIPRELIDHVKKNPVKYQAEVKTDKGIEYMSHDQGYIYPLHPGFYDIQARLEDMDARNIDIDILSISPTMYYYWADSNLTLEVARLSNDCAYKMVRTCPDRFQAMATVPIQNVELAIEELERVVNEYNFKFVSIGTSVEGRNLDEAYYFPFFQKAEELDVAVMFHPYYVGERLSLKDFYLTNLIGNPLDTTICISRIVLGGILEKLPSSKFIFVHAGGYIPYQRGRLQHGYEVRNEPRVVLKNNCISCYFDEIYYDTITHWLPALKYLIETHSTDRILLGSDYPFDMADPSPVSTVKAINLDYTTEKKVLGDNAKKIISSDKLKDSR